MKKSICMLLLVVFALAGCSSQQTGSSATDPAPAPASEVAQEADAPSSSEPKETAENAQSSQILFNGSSTLAPVISSIALAFNEEYSTWDKVDAGFPNENISIYVSSGGSGQGVRAVLDKTTDFGMLARKVKDSEKEEIPEIKEYMVGIDALTIAVNHNNPLSTLKENLTKEEIVKIFSGEYAKWSDLDPSLPDNEIVVVIRDIGGGAHEVFQNNIMGDTEVSADAIQAPSMGALVTKVIENDNAVGYASFGVSNQNAGSLKMFEVDGVAPTVESILDGSYIIQRPLLLIKSGEPTEMQQAFLDVVLGEEGQEIVEKSGFIHAN